MRAARARQLVNVTLKWLYVQSRAVAFEQASLFSTLHNDRFQHFKFFNCRLVISDGQLWDLRVSFVHECKRQPDHI